MGDATYDSNVLKALVKTNPLVIFDNIQGKSYYPIFDNYNFEKNEIPLMISRSWSMGGGGITPDYLSFFLDPKSNLYLPTIVISGLIGNLSFELAKKVFSLFKDKFSGKRQTIIYYSEKDEATYYEFPSETSDKDFTEGLEDIPKTATKAAPQSYFVRSLKSKIWFLEDKS